MVLYFRMARLVSPYHIVNDTISFVLLDSLLRSSIYLMNAFVDQISFNCDISPPLTYVSFLSSFCNDLEAPTLPEGQCLLDEIKPNNEDSKRRTMPFANFTNSCFQSELWFCPERDYQV